MTKYKEYKISPDNHEDFPEVLSPGSQIYMYSQPKGWQDKDYYGNNIAGQKKANILVDMSYHKDGEYLLFRVPCLNISPICTAGYWSKQYCSTKELNNHLIKNKPSLSEDIKYEEYREKKLARLNSKQKPEKVLTLLEKQLLVGWDKYWINQPSTLQRYHYLHGMKVYAKRFPLKSLDDTDAYSDIVYIDELDYLWPSSVPSNILSK